MKGSRQEIVRQSAAIRNRIEALPQGARVAVAAFAAQYLVDQHLSQTAEGSEFVAGWIQALSVLWQVLVDPSDEAVVQLRDTLEQYYSGPYCHELGTEALPGADQDAASAAIYATEAYCRGNAKGAALAAILFT